MAMIPDSRGKVKGFAGEPGSLAGTIAGEARFCYNAVDGRRANSQ
ncbi:MAG: hypothetical protein ABSB91_00690 [Sedimentisphaerales bacterium]